MTLRANVLTLAILIASSFVSSSPVASPPTCTPNFQAHPQSIFVRPEVIDRAAFEWKADSIFPGAHVQLQLHNLPDTLAQGEFVVESTGQPNGSFRFKLTADTNRYIALTAGPGGNIAFDSASNAYIPTQEFTIACNSCFSSGAGAEICTIKNPASGQCITGSANGETLHLGSCDSAGAYSFSDGTTV